MVAGKDKYCFVDYKNNAINIMRHAKALIKLTF